MHLTPARHTKAGVRLEPLDRAHADGLRLAARIDPAIWRWWPRGDFGADFEAQFAWQLDEHACGRWLIHTVFDAAGAIVGQTCFLNIRADHAGVEIGGTWYAPGAQGGIVNPACKLMMFAHAFACGAERVELKTDALNAGSRAAIAKLGATFEGVFRRHLRRPDGSWRDTAWYSVLREEWPAVRARLDLRLVNVSA